MFKYNKLLLKCIEKWKISNYRISKCKESKEISGVSEAPTVDSYLVKKDCYTLAKSTIYLRSLEDDAKFGQVDKAIEHYKIKRSYEFQKFCSRELLVKKTTKRTRIINSKKN